MVIAIDGPGGVGKSTVTRAVALALNLDYLDTGSTYRAATLAVLRAGLDLADTAAVTALVEQITIGYEAGIVYLDGVDVSGDVRSEAVTAAVSPISAIAEVRRCIVAGQRSWVAERGGNAVVEGRDIGTVVFPDALVKVFLTARSDVRAARRATDAEAEGQAVEAIQDALDRRDRYDSGREVSPMQPADDAVVIDTSDLTVNEVVGAILRLAGAASQQAARGPL